MVIAAVLPVAQGSMVRLADDVLDAAKTLVRIGLHADEAGQIIRELARASRQGEFVEGGVTVIGKFASGYIEEATKQGAVFFDIPPELHALLKAAGDDFVRAVNQQFLDEAIAAGQQFSIVAPPGEFTGTLAWEVQYLVDHGYVLSADTKWLLPGG
jgi:hypothetical protein